MPAVERPRSSATTSQPNPSRCVARSATSPRQIAVYGSLTGAASLDYYADIQQREPVRRDELAERLQLSRADLGRRVRDYSRGMRQKIGVIQALQHDPEPCSSEPTEGLDPLMQLAFYEVLEDLH